MHQCCEAHHRGSGGLGHRRTGLRTEPGECRFEPLRVEVVVEDGVAGGEEGLRYGNRVGDVRRSKEGGAQSPRGGWFRETGHHALGERFPFGDEATVGGSIAMAAGSGDRFTRVVEVAVEHDPWLVGTGRRGREGPRVAVEITKAVVAEFEFLGNARVPDHQVGR